MRDPLPSPEGANRNNSTPCPGHCRCHRAGSSCEHRAAGVGNSGLRIDDVDLCWERRPDTLRPDLIG